LRANDGRTEVLDHLFAGVGENALGMEPDADVWSIPIADALAVLPSSSVHAVSTRASGSVSASMAREW
jgi:hypothetical protein